MVVVGDGGWGIKIRTSTKFFSASAGVVGGFLWRTIFTLLFLFFS